MYYSACAFLQSKDMYGWNAATPTPPDEGLTLALWNLNPPHFHLILLPFTWLPPNLARLVCSLRLMITELQWAPSLRSRYVGLVALLAFAGTGTMILTGQLTLILLPLVTGCWLVARQNRWRTAGVLLGIALSIKPFLLILLPYFLICRRWSALATTVASATLCFALGLLVFGLENHLAWLERLGESAHWAWLPMNASIQGMLSRTFGENQIFTTFLNLPNPALDTIFLLAAATVGAVTFVGLPREAPPASVDRAFALLLVTTLLLCPLGWVYYFWLPLGPVMAVVKGWRESPGPTDRRQRFARRIFWIACIGLFWPVQLCLLFQPSGWATFFLGNVFFWTIFAMWLGLLLHEWPPFSRHVGRFEGALTIATTPSTTMRKAVPLVRLSPSNYRISVVLPVYSETETVRKIATWLRENLGGQLEEIIIVLSPRSQQASREVCEALAREDERIRVHVQENNPGLGHAVREGLARTHGNLVLMMDSDGEMENETVLRMLAEMAGGNHAAVFASRWGKGGGFSGYSRLKYVLNWGFQQLFRVLFWTPIRDLTYGFKLMRGELARGILWQGTLHEIACETTLKPIRLGVSVAQVPSRWTARTSGASKNTFFRNFRYVAMALKVRFLKVDWWKPASEPVAAQPAPLAVAR
jgi:hypothetical protein